MQKLKLLVTFILFTTLNGNAQYTKLLDFDSIHNGSHPEGYLIFEGTYLYGMTPEGGTHNDGTIFKIKPDGTGYNKLYDFDSIHGSNPYGSLISDGTFLYGTTTNDCKYSYGNVFKIKPDGTMFDTLRSFGHNLDDAANPEGSIFFDGSFLYGTTISGGPNSNGIIFKIKPNATGYTELKVFNENNGGEVVSRGDFISDGTFLYGMAEIGGTNNLGYIYKIKPDGTSFTTLLTFDSINGSKPNGALIGVGNFLYGMTRDGGTNNKGTIFKIKPDGTGYTNILNFNGSNGSNPLGSLFYDGDFLYGTTVFGGTNDNGILFKIKIDGTSYSTLYDFSNTVNGAMPICSLYADGTFFYGMTYQGGTYNYGTIFKYQYCTANCCFSHYTAAYDTLQNTFTLTVDASTVSLASSYYWDFGDGSFSTQSTPTHNYTKDSTYNVILKVKTTNGDSCSYSHIIGKDAQGNIYRTSGFTLKVVGLVTATTAPVQTSIENNVINEGVSVFPNPTTGSLTLSKGEGTVTVCNVLGEKVHQSVITNQQLQIDLSSQPNGVYFISIQTSEGKVNKKIVMSH